MKFLACQERCRRFSAGGVTDDTHTTYDNGQSLKLLKLDQASSLLQM
jgi:hypothetical protein